MMIVLLFSIILNFQVQNVLNCFEIQENNVIIYLYYLKKYYIYGFKCVGFLERKMCNINCYNTKYIFVSLVVIF